ncbi:hemicentin-1-like isoform X2 [Ischnura elegans]|uniref:hemicentin-1-like isoform X2 n=1 Tax=Ischnura elegans TaxID=197161 RepID=UPI001ED89BAF|nr:hemicentin-1-like isoform X2 [Ischnura elegans]
MQATGQVNRVIMGLDPAPKGRCVAAQGSATQGRAPTCRSLRRPRRLRSTILPRLRLSVTLFLTALGSPVFASAEPSAVGNPSSPGGPAPAPPGSSTLRSSASPAKTSRFPEPGPPAQGRVSVPLLPPPPPPPMMGVERPYFDDVSPRNVTAIVGQSAILNCRVKHLGDRTVSWMRKRDLHILTSSIFTYTGDGRFGVIHPEGSDEWNLRVEYVQKRDAGIYECQVNTEPKINMAILLNVEAAQASIHGPEEIHVKKGSTISLTCTVNVPSTPPSSVLWYRGSSVVDFDSPRGGVSLETEKTEAGTTSKLLVTKATVSDSGNYTCVPSSAEPASVWVHVLNGEHPAAIHGDHGASSRFASPPYVLLFCVSASLAASVGIPGGAIFPR